MTFNQDKLDILDASGIESVIPNKITLQLESMCNDSRQILSIITNSMTNRISDPKRALLVDKDRIPADWDRWRAKDAYLLPKYL